MHISSTGPVTTQPATSKTVPPGLAKRDLALPPGIAKKLAAGGTPPPGIAKRFPAAIVPPTSDTTETETGGGAPAADASSPDNTTSSVDLLV